MHAVNCYRFLLVRNIMFEFIDLLMFLLCAGVLIIALMLCAYVIVMIGALIYREAKQRFKGKQ